jgi:hypothetical protein
MQEAMSGRVGCESLDWLLCQDSMDIGALPSADGGPKAEHGLLCRSKAYH